MPNQPPQFHPLMAERLPLIQGHASFADVPREQLARWDAPYGPVEEWDLRIEDRELPGPHGSVPVRIYQPAAGAGGGRPGLVWIHGGAFIFGDLDMPEAHEVSRGIAGRTGAVVVSVFYRLCPPPASMRLGLPEAVQSDVRFPVPLDDVVAAVDWTREHAAELGVDRSRIAVGGTSAGGNLAAGATVRLIDEGEAPWQAFLIYPLVHPELPPPTPEMTSALAAVPPALNFPDQSVRDLNENYLGAGVDTATPYAFAGLAEDLSGFPPTLVDNCEFDSLRRSGERFADQLRDAGVDVESVISRGVPHGHLNCVGFPPAFASIDRIAERLRRPATT